MAMSDAEIREEAQRRLSAMSEAEKLDLFRLSKREKQFLAHVETAGISSLDKRQNRRFRRLLRKQASRSCAGGVRTASFVKRLLDENKITEDDLRSGKVKSPYIMDIRSDAGTLVLMNVVGYMLIRLHVGGVTLRSANAIVGLELFRQFRAHRRLRKINRRYMSGSMDEAEVKEAMMQSILAESVKRWDH